MTLRTDVGSNMTDNIKWYHRQINLRKFMLDNVHEIFKIVEEKNKEVMQAYEKMEKLQRDVGSYAMRRLQRQQNAWYHKIILLNFGSIYMYCMYYCVVIQIS